MTAQSPTLPGLLYPERVADATVRGFLTQAYYSAIRWLELGPDELLLCEGDEDIDRYVFHPDGSLREMRQEQIKDLSGALSARSEPVHQSLFNFLVSFVAHRKEGRRCLFVFVTNADFADQQVQGDADKPSKTKVALAIDVLRTWSNLASSASLDEDRTALAKAVRALVEGYAVDAPPTTDGAKAAKDKRVVPSALVTEALAYVEQQGHWADFLASIEWKLEQPSHAALESLLFERFRGDPRTERAPDLLAQRAVVRVLTASSCSAVSERLLGRAELDELVRATEDELKAWADTHHPERLSSWFKSVEALQQEVEAIRVGVDKLASEPRERLQRTSDRAIVRLGRASSLRMPTGTLTITRPVAKSMVAMTGSFLVIGDPGAGKSGALFSLVEGLKAAGHEVLVLSADLLPDPGEVLSTLRSWPVSPRPRTLIIDALDAARGESAVARVRALLQDLTSNAYGWRLVASIRTFDLEAQSEFASLFAGPPDPVHFDKRFASTAHVRVGRLGDAELGQLGGYPQLEAVVRKAPRELRELLRVPFHLSLVADLLAGGDEDVELSDVTTQLDLLARYWSVRVNTPPSSKYSRSALLYRLCDEIVRARVFWAEHHTLPELHELPGLLSNQVLVHPAGVVEDVDEQRVGFAHHLLFDYACARLWMPKTPEQLAQALRANPDLLLVARPSLDMRLRYLWEADPSRATFWRAVLAVASATSVSEVGQIVGATVAAELATSLDDFRPLLDAAAHPADRKAVSRALRHCIESRRDMRSRDLALPSGPWPSLLDAVMSLGHEPLFFSVLPLLRDLCAARPVGEDAQPLNRAAQRALAWAVTGNNDQLVGATARMVACTFGADPRLSEAALDALLEDSALGRWGHETLLAMAESSLAILAARPGFLDKLYAVVFRVAFEAPDDGEETVDRGGPVMGLRFRRPDMLRSAAHLLAKDFPELLKRDPALGLRVLVRALTTFKPSFSTDGTDSFAVTFRGQRTEVKEDGSYVWDNRLSSRGGEPQLQMLDRWEARLVEVCAGPDTGARQAFLDALACGGALAVIWRRVLRAAATHPGVVGPCVLDLLACPGLLGSLSTTTQAGEALRGIFPRLAPQDRVPVEDVILHLGGINGSDDRARRIRARLLGCLNAADLVSQEARDAFGAQEKTEGGFPKNNPAFQFTSSVEPFDEDEDLRQRGVDLAAPSQRRLHVAIEPLRKFLSVTVNAQPSSEQVDEVLRDANTAIAILTEYGAQAAQGVPGGEPIAPPSAALEQHGWAKVAAVCERIANRIEGQAAEVASRLGAIALAASTARVTQGADASYVRQSLARALWWLSTYDADGAEAREVLERWAADGDRNLRTTVMREVHLLGAKDPDRLERMLARVEREEQEDLVWGGSGTAMNSLEDSHPDRVRDHAFRALDLVRDTQVRSLFLNQLVWLAMTTGDAAALARLEAIARVSDSPDAASVAQWLTEYLVADLASGSATGARAQRLGETLAETARAGIERWRASPAPHDTQAAKPFGEVLDALARPLARAAEDILAMAGEVAEQRARLGRLFARVRKILDDIAATGEPSLVHQVVETLPARRLVDPRDAFLTAAELVRSGARGGYQTDWVASEAVVALLERSLADDRALLQDDPACRAALFEMLDTFVRAGWEKARRLTHRLDEIFR